MISKRRVWELLQVAKPGDHVGRVLDVFLLTLIALNVIAVVIGSVDSVERQWGFGLEAFELFSVIVFTIEYLARVYTCVTENRFAHPLFRSPPLYRQSDGLN
ncbi:MAG TPA: hypothetical protein VM940_05410 [Chthoniobacterales bacterium]|jgi:voltage-gated potassium channel|nr:hypothetical protein [Chthoniobacterales bacterium]